MLAAGLSPRTLRDAHNLLARCLDDAQRHRLLAKNVARLQRPPRAPRQEVSILTQEQATKVLSTLRDDVFYVPVVIALFCGLRRGEQLALTWGDIDLDAKTLRVEHALEDTRARGVVIKAPKTAAGRRTVSLPDIACAALREHRRRQLELRLQLGIGRLDEDTPVFPELPSFTYQAPRVFTVRWCRTIARLHLPRIGWHSLRHCHASMLIHAGVDVATIAKRLGHASPAITLSTYAHCFTSDDRAAAEALDHMAY